MYFSDLQGKKGLLKEDMERTDLRTSQPGLRESPAPERPGSGTPSMLSLCLEAALGEHSLGEDTWHVHPARFSLWGDLSGTFPRLPPARADLTWFHVYSDKVQ